MAEMWDLIDTVLMFFFAVGVIAWHLKWVIVMAAIVVCVYQRIKRGKGKSKWIG